MPFSFNPGQEQAAAGAPVTQSNNGVPVLVVPSIPSIAPGGNEVEKISPFAFKNRSKSKFGVYFQGVIFLIFISMAVASIALFSYQGVIKLQIASKKETLDLLQASYKKPPIEEMKKLSSRLNLINKIMNERVSVRTAFTILEESVNGPVKYNEFSLSRSKKENSYVLSFAGETNSYSALYQQVEVLNSKVFKPVFPKLSITGIGPLDKKGIASFKVDATVAISGINPDDGYSVIGKNSKSTSTPEVSRSEASNDVISSSTLPLQVTQ
jgi:hypothetical protein